MGNWLYKIFICGFILLINSKLYAQYDTGYVAVDIAQMEDYNLYPSYDVYLQMMERFATEHPDICKLIEIGNSVQNRKLLAVKISDNVGDEEFSEPEFFYSSTIHGDELCGFNFMLRLINDLLINYGSDSYITWLVDNVQIYINPLANPDGLYNGNNNYVTNSTRYNANGVDLNRSFPTINNPVFDFYEPEVKAMIDFANAHYFSISANLHSGSEILNYPWDSFYDSELPLPDNSWFEQICSKYVTTARKIDPEYMESEIAQCGYVFGSQWYKISGGRQDYMNYFMRCREITIELSNAYFLHPDFLDEYWHKNRASLINLIGESLHGVTGRVTDFNGNEVNNAEVIVLDQDKNYTTVFTNKGGYYFRYLPPGDVYEFSVYADGYETINQVVATQKDTLVSLDFMLRNGIAYYPLPPIEGVEGEVAFSAQFDGGKIVVESSKPISDLVVVDSYGRILVKSKPKKFKSEYTLNNCSHGVCVIKAECGGKSFTHKLFITK
ncbi:MAG: carboxypeptidase regulatory-like domain-containing protein [Bacteroidales bacterium]|nr:carboxypeptidase regulatory-like domain-containing protein [Bacteroidales bacterium]